MKLRILPFCIISMLFVSSMLFVGCAGLSKKSNTANVDTINIIGRWTTDAPNDSAVKIGIELKVNGVASSINMPTLPYDHWKKVNDSTVAIHGTSVLDGEKTELTDTFDIDKTKQTLNQRGSDILYKRAN